MGGLESVVYSPPMPWSLLPNLCRVRQWKSAPAQKRAAAKARASGAASSCVCSGECREISTE